MKKLSEVRLSIEVRKGKMASNPSGVQHMPIRLRRVVQTALQEASMCIHLTNWTPLSHETHLTHLTHLTDWTPLSHETHLTHWTH